MRKAPQEAIDKAKTYHKVRLCMKRYVLFSILFIACATFQCAPQYSGKKQPKAIKGVLDLQGWNFEKDGPLKLHGEWEFRLHSEAEERAFLGRSGRGLYLVLTLLKPPLRAHVTS